MALADLRSKLSDVSLASTMLAQGRSLALEGDPLAPPEILAGLREILRTRASDYEAEWKRRWLSSVFEVDALFAHNKFILANAEFNALDPDAEEAQVDHRLADLRTTIRHSMELMESRIIRPRPWRRTVRDLNKDERTKARHDRFEAEWAKVRAEPIPFEEFFGGSDSPAEDQRE